MLEIIDMEQLNQEQAKAFYDSDVWKDWTDEQIFRFQLFQDLLCVDWTRFHIAAKKVLGRPVYSHEFMSSNSNYITEEYLGCRNAPNLDEIINLIPPDKRITIEI